MERPSGELLRDTGSGISKRGSMRSRTCECTRIGPSISESGLVFVRLALDKEYVITNISISRPVPDIIWPKRMDITAAL